MAKANQPTSRGKGRIREYFKGIRLELKKVIWPSKPEMISYTWAVIIICAVCAVGLWAVDSVCALGLQKLLDISISM